MKNDTPSISVLMSTYNESERHIREAVESILAQTFTDYELIVVNDNPKFAEVEEILCSYHDSRIRYYQNPQNIGLAMSMNRAAKLARADVFARMDSDDVAEPTRFEKEYQIIASGECDFVFSQYSQIDDESKAVGGVRGGYWGDDAGLNRSVQIKNCIHHPTAMFTRRIFEQTGGYRDFPCAQDVDLWMRMAEEGCRFHCINESLLRYRINGNSVSHKRYFKQQLTIHYCYRLSIERLTTGRDSFSKDAYEKFLSDNGLGNEHTENRYARSTAHLSAAAIARSRGNYPAYLWHRVYVFFTQPLLRQLYLSQYRKKKLLKREHAR